MRIFFVHYLLEPVMMRTLSVAMQLVKCVWWTRHVYRIHMQNRKKKSLVERWTRRLSVDVDFLCFQETIEQVKVSTKKYTVKPPKDLTSKYDAYMKQRDIDKKKEHENRLKEEENRRIAVNLNHFFSWIEKRISFSIEGNRKTITRSGVRYPCSCLGSRFAR